MRLYEAGLHDGHTGAARDPYAMHQLMIRSTYTCVYERAERALHSYYVTMQRQVPR